MNKRTELQKAVQAALDRGCTEKQIAAEFSCPLPTVARWLNGMATPHPIMQSVIIQGLNEMKRPEPKP